VLALIPLPVQIAAASLPVFTRLAAKDRTALREMFGTLLRLFCLAGLAAAPGVAIVAGAAVALVYGPAFAAAGPALRIMAIGLLGIFPTQVCVNLLVATGNQRTLLVIDGAALVWQFAVDVIAIPRNGVDGAAFGTASAEIVVAILFFGAAVRVAGMPLIGSLWRALPAAVGLSLAASTLLRLGGMVPAIAGGAIVYAALLIIFGAISQKDVQMWRSALQRRPPHE
jgi:O-antigen/teichoic acid export membrane protein